MCSSMGSLAYAKRLGRHIVGEKKGSHLGTMAITTYFFKHHLHIMHIAIVSKHYKASHRFLKTSTTSSMIQSSKLLIASKMSNALEIHSHHVSATH